MASLEYDGCISYHEVAIKSNDDRNETIPGREDKEDDHCEEARWLRPSSFLYLVHICLYLYSYMFVNRQMQKTGATYLEVEEGRLSKSWTRAVRMFAMQSVTIKPFTPVFSFRRITTNAATLTMVVAMQIWMQAFR